MRKLSSFLLLTLLIGYIAPAFAQSSTEGKEFWVALNMTTGTGGDEHEPFICITTQHEGGTFQITNPADASFTPINGKIPAMGYIKITASESPAAGEINLKKWYPVGETAQTMSNKTKPVGLKITTTVDCSVYAGNRLPQSFDAANILPITALQTEYITQDYPGYDHENKGGGYPVTTILATENNTQVTFIPSSTVLNGNGTSPITKTLQAGEVWYLTGDNRATLSGSIVNSDKKIAVFTGVNNTDVPGPVSARDHLYEQNMPVEYWGTHFVVTRSMKKDANRIRVTAKENNTQIFLDGSSTPAATINSGDTYEFELCSAIMRTEEGYTKAQNEGRGTEYFLEGEAHYLETSCPCAVFSYDVSENYYIKKNGTSERDENAHGDPSMVWISPIEQQLRKVTFGVMNTLKTTTHYVNIITPTKGASSLEVREVTDNNGKIDLGPNIVQPSDIMTVSGNSAYSYARIKLNENTESVYTITSDVGFIAHVYGSGDKESYAYSAGSAAVQYGVLLEDETFTDGYRSDKRYCMGTELEFDATIGTSMISSVNWDFGDGITDMNGAPVTTHTYNSPGWYDVTAELYGKQACSNVSNQLIATVNFTFRVWQPKTKMGTVQPPICIEADSTLDGRKLTAAELQDLLLHGKNDTVIPNECYEDTIVNYVTYGLKTKDKKYGKDTIGYDQIVLNDSTYTLDNLPPGDIVEWTETNQYGCDSLFKYHVIIRTCLDIDITNPDPATQYTCLGEPLPIHYEIIKGDIDGNAVFTIDELPMISKEITIPQTPSEGWINLPVEDIQKPGIYHGHITVKDRWCPNTFDFPLDIVIRYPNDVFKFKFYNVLAVRQDAGYNFIHYQWYINNQPVGGDVSVLYLGEDVVLQDSDVVYVKLTDQNGMVLESCPQTNLYEGKPIKPNKAPVQKIIKNQRMYILRDEQMYDMFGREVK